MNRPSGNRSLVAGGVVMGLALISVFGEWTDRQRADAEPTAATTRAAVERVRAEFTEGDVVWVHPHWWEAPWHHLEGAGAGANAPPYPALLRDPTPDPVRLFEARRLWILAGFGREVAVGGLIAPAPAASLSEEVGPGVRVLRYDLGEPEVIPRLTDQLNSVTVERTRPGGDTVSCPLKGDRFVCKMDRWLDVDVRTRDVAGRHVRWLYAHPGPHSGTLAVRWAGVPRGQALLVRFGHTQAAVRRDKGLPTTVRILVDGEPMDEVVLEPHAYVSQQRLVMLTPGPPIEVRVEIQSADPRWREVMLQGEMLPRLSPIIEAGATRAASYGAPAGTL